MSGEDDLPLRPVNVSVTDHPQRDVVLRVWGLDVIVCTTAKTDDEARALLDAFNFPFRKSQQRKAA